MRVNLNLKLRGRERLFLVIQDCNNVVIFLFLIFLGYAFVGYRPTQLYGMEKEW